MIQQTIIALGLGFSLWLAVFPFYSWIPLLTAENEPYAVGFFLLFYPMTTLHLAMKFLNTYSWLREILLLQDVLQSAGILLILSSGVLSLYQRDIRKLFGYFVMMENGFSLLAISLDTQLGYQIYFAAMFPRLLVYALWTYASSKLSGLAPRQPVNTGKWGIYLLIMIFGLIASIGLPLLGNSAYRIHVITLFSGQATQINLLIAGILCYGFGVLRIINELVNTQIEYLKEISWSTLLRFESILLGIGIFLVVLIGFLPNLFAEACNLLIQIYDKLIA